MSRSVLTAGLSTGPKLGFCGDCNGKGFSKSFGKSRHHRKCMRCRGVGSVRVGSTKR